MQGPQISGTHIARQPRQTLHRDCPAAALLFQTEDIWKTVFQIIDIDNSDIDQV